MKNKAMKHDLYLISGVILIAILIFFIYRVFFSAPPVTAQVNVDGKTVLELDLTKDTDRVISGYGNGTNRIVVKDGAIWVEEASCPDKVCVRTGKINSTGEVIACLPNRMIITIK